MAMFTMTCSMLFQGLTAHTHQCDVKRVFGLVLEAEVVDALLSCAVEAYNILVHVKPLSLFLYRLLATRSCESVAWKSPTDECLSSLPTPRW